MYNYNKIIAFMHDKCIIIRRIIMKKNIISAIVLSSMLLLAACSGSSNEAATQAANAGSEAAADQTTAAGESAATGELKLVEAGKLIVSTNAEFPPYEYYDANEIVGIDVEIAKAIADKMGLELEVKDGAFDAIIAEVVSGKADVGIAGMTATDERKQNVDFSDSYATGTQVIIVKEGSEIKSAADLEGKSIGVQLGTTGDIMATDVKDSKVEQYNKGMDAVQALSQGKIDAVIIDNEPAKFYEKEVSGLKILDEAFAVEEYAIALKKGNTELQTKINETLKELKAEGKIDEIIAKYIKAE
jgi:hypothetical protein